MKTLLAASFLSLGILTAPHAGADPSPWCEWSPELDTSSCDLIVGVPPQGTLVDGPGDWSQPETRTRG
ncbi:MULTISPECIES: hypothetical protein [unclassified Mycobacteroides]|uniref:hypothetical protein n=1 Tax=unclassified Mycobacteroides TaxID=2618759 RepID=UPI0007150DBD|nr:MULTISPECIES: hypothetical protein [unclassified Mycobacteroides]KRQ26389.1 hypothetical protein AOT86_11240 [Mycobacteroides sp. H072]KRQ32589.1 hypothetical protein AOT84_20510 [Mycobacteroides sp. H002]KRQ54015.1 hypothetical protein AOT85_05010 [Mycobacteroides sp. H054]